MEERQKMQKIVLDLNNYPKDKQQQIAKLKIETRIKQLQEYKCHVSQVGRIDLNGSQIFI